MAEQLGVAIVGAGYWGVNYVRVFDELARTRVAVVCDQRPEQLAKVADKYPKVKLTTEASEALATEGVEAVVVCTQAANHFPVAKQAIEAGKHVLIEKPLAATVEECDTLIELARRHRVTLMVGHTFIYNSGVKKVKEYVDQDEIGRVYYLYARRTNLGPIRHDVNALWDLAPHDVSIFNYLLGATPEWVSAVGSKVLQNGREDVGFISLGYAGGIVAHIHVSWADPHKVREVVVVGSDKRIVFNDLAVPEHVRVFEKGVSVKSPENPTFGEYHLEMRDGAIISPRVEVSEPLKNQCIHFVDCVVSGRRPITPGEAGRDVVAVLEAMDRSMELHGAPVQVSVLASGLELKQSNGFVATVP